MGFLVRLTAAEINVPVGSNRNAVGGTHGADRIDGDNLGRHPHKPFRRSRPKQASAGKVRPPHVGRVNVVGASGRGLLTAWPLWQRGLAELMFFRSTPGRMGNLLIPITAPRNQIGLRRFVIWG